MEALSGFDARKRNTNQRNRELTRIGPVQKLRQRCIGKSSEIREGSGAKREREMYRPMSYVTYMVRAYVSISLHPPND